MDLLRTFLLAVAGVHMDAVAGIPRGITCEPYIQNDKLAFASGQQPLHDPVIQIPRINAAELNPQIFWRKYVHANQPVVIQGAAQALFEEWNTSWQVSGLMSRRNADHQIPCGDAEIGNHHFQTGGHFDDSGTWIPRTMSLVDIFNSSSRAVHWRQRPFSSIREGDNLTDSLEGNRLFSEYFWKLKPRSFLSVAEARHADPSEFYLHFSNQGGSMPHNHAPALNILFQGAKRWIISELDTWLKSRPNGRRTFQAGRSESTTSLEWFEENAASLNFTHYDFVQMQGEAVFVPNRFIHTTIDLCTHSTGAVLMGQVLKEGEEQAGSAMYLNESEECGVESC